MTEDHPELSPDLEQSIDEAFVTAKLEELLEEMPCPKCGMVGMMLGWKFLAKGLPSFPLSGSDITFTANKIPAIYCPSCGLYAEGNTVHDGTT